MGQAGRASAGAASAPATDTADSAPVSAPAAASSAPVTRTSGFKPRSGGGDGASSETSETISNGAHAAGAGRQKAGTTSGARSETT